MTKITRTATVEESLELAMCPRCRGDIAVRDCGYSSANPGFAECTNCGLKVALGYVDDRWDAGVRWNHLAGYIVEIHDVTDRLTRLLESGTLPVANWMGRASAAAIRLKVYITSPMPSG